MDLIEVKESVDGLGRAWAEYRDTNDARLDEIEKKGSADALFTEKLDKLNGRLDRLETVRNRSATQISLASGTVVEDKTATWSEERRAFDNWMRRSEQSQHLRSIADDPAIGGTIKSLSVGNDAAAGFLAPVEFVREIIKAEVEFSPIRAVARVRQTEMRSLRLPKRTGTFAAGWVAEQGTRSETTGLTYGMEEIPLHELYALVDISEQMLEDSAFNLDEELNQEFGEQFGVLEGASFVNGNGAGKPEGLLQNTAIAEVNSGSATTVADANGQADGIVDMFHTIKTAYASRGIWLLNRSTLGQLRKLKTSTTNEYIWQPGVATGNPNVILGSPYVEVPDMPDQAAGTYPLMFGDWMRTYTIADRIVMSILRDPYSMATSGNVRFLARKRVGGQVVLTEAAIKLKVSV